MTQTLRALPAFPEDPSVCPSFLSVMQAPAIVQQPASVTCLLTVPSGTNWINNLFPETPQPESKPGPAPAVTSRGRSCSTTYHSRNPRQKRIDRTWSQIWKGEKTSRLSDTSPHHRSFRSEVKRHAHNSAMPRLPTAEVWVQILGGHLTGCKTLIDNSHFSSFIVIYIC